MRTAVYPGTFDPVTRGHLDLIARAAALFDRLIVAMGKNPAKKPVLANRARLDLLRQETQGMEGVEVAPFEGLLVDFARKVGAEVVVRGIRSTSDVEYELQMALANRAAGGLETIFLTPRPDYQFLSAQLIREIVAMGGDASAFLTPNVEARLKDEYAKARVRKDGRPRESYR